MEPSVKVEYTATGNVLFILNISATASLINGFRYIKELLMQHHNFYMNDCYETLLNNNIKVSTVKTDALTINSGNLKQAKKLLNFKIRIGNWRASKTEESKFSNCKIELKENTEVIIEDLKLNHIDLTIEEEYDTDHLCNLFEEHKKVMIRAEYAGSGKSFSCEHMLHRGHKVVPMPYQCAT